MLSAGADVGGGGRVGTGLTVPSSTQEPQGPGTAQVAWCPERPVPSEACVSGSGPSPCVRGSGPRLQAQCPGPRGLRREVWGGPGELGCVCACVCSQDTNYAHDNKDLPPARTLEVTLDPGLLGSTSPDCSHVVFEGGVLQSSGMGTPEPCPPPLPSAAVSGPLSWAGVCSWGSWEGALRP